MLVECLCKHFLVLKEALLDQMIPKKVIFSGHLWKECGYDSENMDKLGLVLRPAAIFPFRNIQSGLFLSFCVIFPYCVMQIFFV